MAKHGRGRPPSDSSPPPYTSSSPSTNSSQSPNRRPPRQSMQDIMSDPTLVRNVALVGHLQHGKTAFLNMLVEISSQITAENREKCMRFDDALVDKQGKKMSSKAIPNSLILEDSNSQRYMCNIIDTPGHVDFSDEMTAALRLVDGVVLIVDAAEGVRMNTLRAIQHALRDRLKIVVVLNKVDRLITELELSYEAAYQILARIIETINEHITTDECVQPINPANGNVCFASGSGGWCFTLQSFAKKTLTEGNSSDANKLASQLWGDFFCDDDTGTFSHEKPSEEKQRSFVEFFLEPLHTLYKSGEDDPRSGGNMIFGSTFAFTDMLVGHIPSAKEAASLKLENVFSGPKDDRLYIAMEECDPSGPLMVDITKLYHNFDYSRFDALGRVYSGKISKGELVFVLTNEAGETVEQVTKLWIYQAGESIAVEDVYPGSLVVIEGVDVSIKKTATLTSLEYYGKQHVFRPLQFNTIAAMKYIIHSFDDLDELTMANHFIMISKGYPLAVVSSEYEDLAISGTGKLYLDSIVKDFKELNPEIDTFKLSIPTIQLYETVDVMHQDDSPFIRHSTKTADGKLEMTMIAEPLDIEAVEDIENNVVSVDCPDSDLLAASSVWAFGPEKQRPNILFDDTHSSDDDKKRLNAVKDPIVSGFQKVADQGPLCFEPVCNVKFRIVDAIVDANITLERDAIEYFAERLTRNSLRMALPRLMEPVQYMEIQTPKSCVSAVRAILSLKRNIKFIEDVHQLNIGDCILKASLPLIETFSFENELRGQTDGQAFYLSTFDHWETVPGNPLIEGTRAQEYVAEVRRRKCYWKQGV